MPDVRQQLVQHAEAWQRLVSRIRSDLEGLPPPKRVAFGVAVAEATGGRYLTGPDSEALRMVLREAAAFARATAPAAVPRWAPVAEAYAQRLAERRKETTP